MEREYDVAVALGKNWSKDGSYLSRESVLTALAAGEALQRDDVKRVIFSGGYTAGRDHPSEARAMRDHLVASGYNVEGIVLEEESIDTAQNAENVRELILPGERVLGVTTHAHLRRARDIFRNYGVDADFVSSEDALKESRWSGLAEDYVGSLDRVVEELKESVILCPFTTLVDPQGKILRGVTSIIRNK